MAGKTTALMSVDVDILQASILRFCRQRLQILARISSYGNVLNARGVRAICSSGECARCP
ncbi:hypothetical protein VTO73DRAFT_11248 [Trametes versicolor]